MHAALQAVFDEHAKPTHATSQTIYNQLQAIVAAAALVEKQMVRYHELRRAAMLAPQDERYNNLRPKIEQMRGNIEAVERASKQFVSAAETLAATLVQFDRQMHEHRAKLDGA